MICTLTSRAKVKNVVILALVAATGQKGIQEGTFIEKDLGHDPKASRALLYDPVANAITETGCNARFFLRDDAEKAETVKDFVDAAWGSVEKGLTEADLEAALDEANAAVVEAQTALKNASKE